MSRVVHFEIPVEKPERAFKFYAETFGWKIEKRGVADNRWLATADEGDPVNADFFKRASAIGCPVVNSIRVDSVDKYIERVLANGGKIIAPKMSIMGIGYMAYCQDTEDNIFGIFQEDPHAGPESYH